MKRLFLLLTCNVLILSIAAPAFAMPRVFVSGFGNNTNTGTLTSPVRDLGKAMNKVDPNGEVIILDSANYSPVTISKPVTIVATGVHAVIDAASFEPGIGVDATTTGIVTLRGLTINGGMEGIILYSAKALHVENCVIKRASGAGILSTANGHIFVKDTIISDCGGSGIDLGSPGLRLSASNVRLENNAANGLQLGSGARAWLSHSVSSGNNGGVSVNSTGAATEADVEDCALTGNVGALASTGAAATIRASNSTMTGNTGVAVSSSSSGKVLSRGNNTVEGNGANGAFTGTFASK
jgi:hypothetical protein